MMSKTHIVTGLAAAFTVLHPETYKAAVPVMIGGSIGSVICDIDQRRDSGSKDARYGRFIVFLLTAAAVALDARTEGLVTQYLMKLDRKMVPGIILLLFTGMASRYMDHRGFSHSFCALGLYAAGIYLVCPPVTEAFFIAFVSHILLDLLNRRPLKLLFPAKKGFCLKWFYADRFANTVFLFLGCVWLAGAVWMCAGH